MITAHEIEGLFIEWEYDTAGQSVVRLKEPAAKKLLALGDEAVPYLLARIRDFGPSMFYQMMLRAITKVDLWEGREVTDKMRAYNVSESGKLWTKWADEKGIKYDHIQWANRRADFGTCWKCLRANTDFKRETDLKEIRTDTICPNCGVIRHAVWQQQWNTRIAPSPTGDMHIGTARTAYFNWLAARASGGKFILRIDDTDLSRSKPEYIKVITDTLDWLGLDYDDIIYQSKRFDRYRQSAQNLVDRKLAVVESNGAIRLNLPNATTPEEIKAEGTSVFAWGRPTHWWDNVLNGTTSPADRSDDEKGVPITAKDWEEINRLVLIKADGSPTYNFATVIDDSALFPSPKPRHEYDNYHINLVIRGTDHITNTAKQVAIAKLLGGMGSPEFAHVGLINMHGKPLSKRDGAASMLYYREKGYDPDAMLNFLVRMGWGPKVDDKTTKILPRKRMLELFLNGGSMRAKDSNFDLDKLESFDRKYKAQKGIWRNGEKLSQ